MIKLWDSNYYSNGRIAINYNFLKNPSCFIILGDLTSDSFYDGIYEIYTSIMSSRNNDYYYVCIVGTKNDLLDSRKVTSEDNLYKFRYLEVNYMECSSKTGYGVKECVLMAARELAEILKKRIERKKYIHSII